MTESDIISIKPAGINCFWLNLFVTGPGLSVSEYHLRKITVI